MKAKKLASISGSKSWILLHAGVCQTKGRADETNPTRAVVIAPFPGEAHSTGPFGVPSWKVSIHVL